ncbi:tannase and feruloyl esterase-domain-containing protein [Xylaria sp. FL0933]|nr:tannase and feruloyl esterase-domain-containing protein [Xylaria sp. FL0933]
MGKPPTQGFYSVAEDTKVCIYYVGFSNGRREGMSQVQRKGELCDETITGVPTSRLAQQQLNHVFSEIIEHVLDYYPPVCALDMIIKLTLPAIDSLDGQADGVIPQSDLCKLESDMKSLIGSWASWRIYSGAPGWVGHQRRGPGLREWNRNLGAQQPVYGQVVDHQQPVGLDNLSSLDDIIYDTLVSWTTRG